MREPVMRGVQIGIDTRKYRVRIHKNILHKMGDPLMVQFLVNPDERVIAVRGVQKRTPGDFSARISPSARHGVESCELYCKLFITKVLTLCNDTVPGRSYMLTGTLLESSGIAYFPLASMEPTSDG